MPELSKEEIQRFSRHIYIPEIGLEGQKRLKSARVLIVGLGGLGCPVAYYLASSGIGELGIVEFDKVDVSNLQRQILYSKWDIGRFKAEVAQERLRAVNEFMKVEIYKEKLEPKNAFDILSSYDVIIDGSDNFATRYLVNDVCVFLKKPYVYGSVHRFEGRASLFFAEKGPCYRCHYGESPQMDLFPTCGESGVLGVLPGIVGLIQATEAIKWIVEIGQSLLGRLLIYDARSMTFQEMPIKKDPDCKICGINPTPRSLDPSLSQDVCGGVTASGSCQVSSLELKTEIQGGKKVVLLDVRDAEERRAYHLRGSSWIPLPELPDRLNEMDRNANIVVYCRSGQRSLLATWLLKGAGFSRIRNLNGGVMSWLEKNGEEMIHCQDRSSE